MSWAQVSNSVCPIARALSLVGDRWTLLLLREVSMGVHRFDELQAQTSMSSHLLTTRLRRMEKDGVLERRSYSDRPVRHEYHATEKGKELDPVLMLLISWGRKWEGDVPPGEPATLFADKATGEPVADLWSFAGGPENFRFDAVTLSVGPTFAAEREARGAAFQETQKVEKKRRRHPRKSS